MNSFSSFMAKGEALAKQMATKAADMAEKAKQEEWVSIVATSVNEVCVFSRFCMKFLLGC